MLKYKSPAASALPPPSVDGLEDATWYLSPKLLIEVILLLFFLVTCNFLFVSLQGNPDQFFINLSLDLLYMNVK